MLRRNRGETQTEPAYHFDMAEDEQPDDEPREDKQSDDEQSDDRDFDAKLRAAAEQFGRLDETVASKAQEAADALQASFGETVAAKMQKLAEEQQAGGTAAEVLKKYADDHEAARQALLDRLTFKVPEVRLDLPEVPDLGKVLAEEHAERARREAAVEQATIHTSAAMGTAVEVLEDLVEQGKATTKINKYSAFVATIALIATLTLLWYTLWSPKGKAPLPVTETPAAAVTASPQPTKGAKGAKASPNPKVQKTSTARTATP